MSISVSEQIYTMVKKIDFTWATTGTTSGSTVQSYDGEVIRIICSNTATTGGTITLADSDSYDLLMGSGVLTTGTAYLGTTDGALANSRLTLGVTSTGAAGTGHVIVYIR